MRCRHEYDLEHGAPGCDVLGLKPFTNRLYAIVWPRNLKLHDLDTYDGKANLEQWVMLYEIAVRAASGDEDMIAN
jgi:hypothetical protein